MQPQLLFLGTLCLLAIGGCAATSSPPSVLNKPVTASPAEEDDAEQVVASPNPQAPKLSGAQILLAEAKIAVDRRDPDKAIVLLERAIRMEPRDSTLWTYLSNAHLQEGNLMAATQHARKAIALAGNDRGKSALAWLQLASILEAQGKTAEAASLRNRYQRFSG